MSSSLPVPTNPDTVMYQNISLNEESARDQSATEDEGNDIDDIRRVAHQPQSEEAIEAQEGMNEQPMQKENEVTTNPPRIDYHALTTSPADPQGNPLRRGKWTPEESNYANRLILEFRRGTLPLPPDVSITLREFLSKLLRCDPMRITKKFEGDNCLRKVVYKSSIASGQEDVASSVREEIRELEAKFLERLDKTKSNSSQAVADKALLESLRSEGGDKDLIDLFCEGMQWEASKERLEEGHTGTEMTAEREITGHSLKRQHQPQTDEMSAFSFQQVLMTQLQNMKKLIEEHHHHQQQQLVEGLASHEINNVKTETEQEEQSIPPFLKKLKIEANYNSAVANLLSVQRMVLDSKHKLYDLEFDKCEMKVNRGSASDAGDMREKRMGAITALREEIERLEAQRVEIASYIEEKYKSGHNNELEV